VAHGKGGHSSRPWALDNPVPKLCEGYLRFAREWDRGANLKEKWRTVLSPTMLKASDARNAIADEAVMHLSCRYISKADYERAVRMLKELTGLEVRATPGRLPVENRAGDPEIAALLDAMKAKLPGGIREGRMSAATDASYYADCGRPIVIFAADGGEPHCDREWGSLKSLDDYADFFTWYLRR
jgi:acetylornithine deacetylase/succinyl-diaminopimelate desuccinylase-like protein